jgi:hypothetical protein
MPLVPFRLDNIGSLRRRCDLSRHEADDPECPLSGRYRGVNGPASETVESPRMTLTGHRELTDGGLLTGNPAVAPYS